MPLTTPTVSPTRLDVLRRAYAHGQITLEQYEHALHELTAAGALGEPYAVR